MSGVTIYYRSKTICSWEGWLHHQQLRPRGIPLGLLPVREDRNEVGNGTICDVLEILPSAVVYFVDWWLHHWQLRPRRIPLGLLPVREDRNEVGILSRYHPCDGLVKGAIKRVLRLAEIQIYLVTSSKLDCIQNDRIALPSRPLPVASHVLSLLRWPHMVLDSVHHCGFNVNSYTLFCNIWIQILLLEYFWNQFVFLFVIYEFEYSYCYNIQIRILLLEYCQFRFGCTNSHTPLEYWSDLNTDSHVIKGGLISIFQWEYTNWYTRFRNGTNLSKM